MVDAFWDFVHATYSILNMFNKKIILASASPRRAEILKMAGVSFDVHPANTEEVVRQNIPPQEVVVDIARQKLEAIRLRFPNKIVLTSDTVVVLENEILGKPNGVEGAKEMLRKISGKVHEVITGVLIARDGFERSFSVTTKVFFKELTEEDIMYYIENYKPFDKAGSYAIQEYIGAVGIEKIEGDYYNVVGLPISRVVQELNNFFKEEPT